MPILQYQQADGISVQGTLFAGSGNGGVDAGVCNFCFSFQNYNTSGAGSVEISGYAEMSGQTTYGTTIIGICNGEFAYYIDSGAGTIDLYYYTNSSNSGAGSVFTVTNTSFLNGGTPASINVQTKTPPQYNVPITVSNMLQELAYTGGLTILNGSVACGQGCAYAGQGANSVAIGYQAGEFNQGASSVAIGDKAGNTGQGSNSISIGAGSGYSNQAANSIILNAGGNFSAGGTGFFVNPISSYIATSLFNSPMFLNSSTNELYQSNVCCNYSGNFSSGVGSPYAVHTFSGSGQSQIWLASAANIGVGGSVSCAGLVQFNPNYSGAVTQIIGQWTTSNAPLLYYVSLYSGSSFAFGFQWSGLSSDTIYWSLMRVM